ncbi:hypothetical protein EVAR_54584_1 [Eumeta japonica]|uniref:Uncharacterized protein n=1 Tax=Eumeta variegata TaxID=151549 RepID=A0A4C1YNN8_EUMVA|nr:hypothetical protein EVAR_54584_1 [Eumeta japonica]
MYDSTGEPNTRSRAGALSAAPPPRRASERCKTVCSLLSYAYVYLRARRPVFNSPLAPIERRWYQLDKSLSNLERVYKQPDPLINM